ncbi:uncharacterized protein LOC129271267 [Lytechinus pictus]|uniref:uncharacterized protein LOC129271267 n=1 Tax=Lytechinus pictus TaxID=7653 RepID=UPI0030B9BFFE
MPVCSMRLIPRWLEEACEGRRNRDASTRSTHRRRPISQPQRFGKRTWDIKGVSSSWSPLLESDLHDKYTHILSADSQISDSTRYVPAYFSSSSSSSTSSSSSSSSSSISSTTNQHLFRNRFTRQGANIYLGLREHHPRKDVLKRIQRNVRIPVRDIDTFTRQAIKETIDKILKYGSRKNARTVRAS